MSHTPGPWTTFQVSDGYLALAGPNGDSLGHFADSRRSVEECRANVILCAAAPDLLAALKRVRSGLLVADLDVSLLLVQAIDVAIAKAEGKAAVMERNAVTITLTGREVAIIGAALRRCIGWDVPRELQRFVNVAAEHVRAGWTEAEMEDVLETLAAAWTADAVDPSEASNTGNPSTRA